MADNDPSAPPYSLSGEVASLTLAAEGASARINRQIRGIYGSTRAYRELFFDADGLLRPAAKLVIEDLIDRADLHRASVDLTPQALAEMEGRRRMVMHIFGKFRLPEQRLRELERQLTKIGE